MVPPVPRLKLAPTSCGDAVCLTVEMAVALGDWINKVEEQRAAVRRCPYVVIK